MKLISNESGQAGGIITVVLGIFIIGFFYVAFSIIMNQMNSVNNDIITNSNIPYSKDHKDATDLNLQYWWGIPILSILVFLIYGIVNALKRKIGEV